MPNANEYGRAPDLTQSDADLRAAYEGARRTLTAEQL